MINKSLSTAKGSSFNEYETEGRTTSQGLNVKPPFIWVFLLEHSIGRSGYILFVDQESGMSESLTKRIKRWVKEVMGGMGGAVVSEKSKTIPPDIGDQPYQDRPKKGVL